MVASICDWPTLTGVTEVQSFIGFINFYQQFIQGCSHIAKPLHSSPRRRGLEMDKADRRPLKSSHHLDPHPCATQPRQTFLTRNGCFQIHHRSGLSQLCKDDKWHPVGFTSRASLMPKGTMRSTTKNSYQSSEAWKSGRSLTHNRDPEQP